MIGSSKLTKEWWYLIIFVLLLMTVSAVGVVQYGKWLFRGASHKDFDDYGLHGLSPQQCLAKAKSSRDPDFLIASINAISLVGAHYCDNDPVAYGQAVKSLSELHDFAGKNFSGISVDYDALSPSHKPSFGQEKPFDLAEFIQLEVCYGLVTLQEICRRSSGPRMEALVREITELHARLEPSPQNEAMHRRWKMTRDQISNEMIILE